MLLEVIGVHGQLVSSIEVIGQLAVVSIDYRLTMIEKSIFLKRIGMQVETYRNLHTPPAL